MSALNKLYQNSPVWLQNAMVSAYGLYWHWARFGGDYQKHETDYRARENYSANEWSAYQKRLVKELLALCLAEVPYYREAWGEAILAAAKEGELGGIPILEKDSLREKPQAFLRQDVKPFPKFVFHTSGTTGTPIQSYYTLSELRRSMAIRESRSANWAGVSFSDARATFSGRLVEPDPLQEKTIYVNRKLVRSAPDLAAPIIYEGQVISAVCPLRCWRWI